ncbi:MAG: bifunctional adenosylcobinamide kinase/adenosylcobinamide-phosphate guanylyltransferase [Clostridiales bacterium]|nr:bifunctional adenosylcobinamide kinase/adenosylcobinamide-phosphate guanylyltransferase [Clostridiales bacterium]
MILVTGGCRSGKSEFAEQLVTKGHKGPWLYIATAKITDKEMEERVRRHRERRSSRWDTYEADENLESFLSSGEIQKYEGILLDSVTTLVTNLLFEQIGEVDWEHFRFEDVDYGLEQQQIMEQFAALCRLCEKLPAVFVTDEIGLGVVPDTCLGRNFRDILGSVNQYIAGLCEEVYFVISGIPVKIKGEPEGKQLDTASGLADRGKDGRFL